MLPHGMEVRLVTTACVTKIEVMDLSSAVELHLHFLITLGHDINTLCKLRATKVLGVIVTVVLKVLRDLGLEEDWEHSSVLPIDNASDVSVFRDEDIAGRKIGVADGWSIQLFSARNEVRRDLQIIDQVFYLDLWIY